MMIILLTIAVVMIILWRRYQPTIERYNNPLGASEEKWYIMWYNLDWHGVARYYKVFRLF